MSQFGLVKTIRLFRTMPLPKQYEFSTIQGMSTDITLQTPANTSDTHKHHSYTAITQSQKNPCLMVALPPGKFLRVRKVFARIYEIHH